MEREKSDKIPLYAKVGWVLCWLLMLILMSMIFRNCMGSIKYGNDTETSQIEFYYNQGYSDAVKSGESRGSELERLENPLLKKAYVKGFREGLGTDKDHRVKNIEKEE